jgi:ribonuclease Y
MSASAFILVILALAAGAALSFFGLRFFGAKRMTEANELAKRIIEEARKEALAQKKEIVLQGKDEVLEAKRVMEQDLKEQEKEIKAKDKKLEEHAEKLEAKLENARRKEQEFIQMEKDFSRKEKELDDLHEDLAQRIGAQEVRLQEIAGLTMDEAKTRLFADIEARTRHEAARMMRHIETEAKEVADRKAKEILATAIQRYAGDYVAEQTVTTVT